MNHSPLQNGADRSPAPLPHAAVAAVTDAGLSDAAISGAAPADAAAPDAASSDAAAKYLAPDAGSSAPGTDATPVPDAALPVPANDLPANDLPTNDLPADLPAAPPVVRSARQMDYDARRARAEILATTTDWPSAAIARQVGVAKSTVTMWKAKHGWHRPEGAPPPLQLGDAKPGRKTGGPKRSPKGRETRMIERLFAVYERQVADIEARLAEPGSRAEEKDARALGTLAKTLETLIALERDAGARTTEPERQDSDRIRAELARRIRSWAEEGEAG